MKDKINITFIFFSVIISRLPFIWNSPGLDLDNWLVLHTGKKILETGSYRASRFPGYPVSEYLASLFGDCAWLILNVLSVLFTALCCVVFYKIIGNLGVKDKVMAALALGFVQAVFIASTSNMEYVWSLFFLLSGLWFILKKYIFWAGVALGLMVSTRFTNIILLMPILYFLYFTVRIRSLKDYLVIFGVAVSTFVLIFTPVFSKYSLNILPDVGESSIDLKSIVSQYTMYIYGVLGILGLLVGCIYIIFSKNLVRNFQSNKEILIFSVLMILITSFLYLKYPFESNYNIPLIPFVILILVFLIQNKMVKNIIFSSFILSPFVIYVSSNKVQFKGTVFVNEKMENDFLVYTKSIHTQFSKIKSDKKVLVAGCFYNCYLYNYPNNNRNIKIYEGPTLDLLKHYISQGYKIYYPITVKKEIENFHHYDISEYGKGILTEFNFDR
ncbi:ArnT family glycosyltransferase [Chryseobacterium sp. GP-SGM7]|uniref:ArnT family glycosyltransferase n=1 Tax=Chryseobacterium sp. GP-SGM7 TaxID=3411323 RepID=UPI003B924FF4